jgi:thymidylate synthase (FAD)
MANDVKLVSITPDAEKSIMYCARVSNPKNQDSDSTKLLSYCIKHGHWSIFEMAHLCIEINTSRAIARQILRHRSFSYQEFSQRYADLKEIQSDRYESEARSQDLSNRQNSNDDLNEETKEWFKKAQEENWNYAHDLYRQAISKGIAKECARVLLPEGQTMSRMYMTGSVRSWIHYLELRTGNGTQKEHIEIAKQIKEIFKQQFPTISNALEW